MIELSLSPESPDQAGLGVAGDTLNTAIYLQRAASDSAVSYVTALGTDPLSERMISFMRAEGLRTDLITRRSDRNPGLYAITTDGDGERSFTYWRGASAARTLFRPPGVSFDDLAEFDLIYLSAITLAILPAQVCNDLIEWLPGYRRQGGQVAFDSNYRPALWSDTATAQDRVAAVWRETDIGLPSVDDEIALFGDADEDAAFARLQGYGLTRGALKRGAAGPRPFGDSVQQAYPSASKVIDSTAAGDSFNGGYLGALVQDADPADCLMAGHLLASQVIGVKGAIMSRDET